MKIIKRLKQVCSSWSTENFNAYCLDSVFEWIFVSVIRSNMIESGSKRVNSVERWRNIFASEIGIAAIDLFNIVKEAEETTLRVFFVGKFKWSKYSATVFGKFEMVNISVIVNGNFSKNFNIFLVIKLFFECFFNTSDTVGTSSLSWLEVFCSAP